MRFPIALLAALCLGASGPLPEEARQVAPPPPPPEPDLGSRWRAAHAYDPGRSYRSTEYHRHDPRTDEDRVALAKAEAKRERRARRNRGQP